MHTYVSAGGLVPPLFLHVPTPSVASDRRLTEGTSERAWEQRVAAIFRSQAGLRLVLVVRCRCLKFLKSVSLPCHAVLLTSSPVACCRLAW